MRRPAVLVAVLLVAGCAPDPAEPAPSSPATGDPAPSAVAAPTPSVRPGASLDRILALHDDDEAFLAGLRAPLRRQAAAVANRHDPAQTDTVRTWVYDGLAIEAYEVTGGPTLIQRVEVTGGGYGTRDGLAVGETRADLEAALGPARTVADGRVVYEVGGDPTPTAVEVRYEPDEDGVERASQIVWLPYVD